MSRTLEFEAEPSYARVSIDAFVRECANYGMIDDLKAEIAKHHDTPGGSSYLDNYEQQRVQIKEWITNMPAWLKQETLKEMLGG